MAYKGTKRGGGRKKKGGVGLPPAPEGANKTGPGTMAPPRDTRGDASTENEVDEPDVEDTDEIILARMIKRFDRCCAAESANRREMLDDKKFKAGDQWDASTRADRETDNRPCLTVNKLPTFVSQVTNPVREERPTINVSPVGDGSDPEVALMFKGLIRHIERLSNADIAYDTAFDDSVSTGLGYFRILTDYEAPDTFNQVVKIARIRNQFSVYLDPAHMDPTGADSRFGFITEMVPREEFKEEYPDVDPVPWDQSGAGDPNRAVWSTKEDIRRVEYFECTYERCKLLLLANGKTVWEDELLPEMKKAIDEGRMGVLRERESFRERVMWYKAIKNTILDRKVWVGTSVPIIKVIGAENDIEGRVTYSGIVRFAKDPQRMYNYWKTAETELIALAPKSPWVAEEGQMEGHESEWKAANRKSIAVLQYKGTSINGNLVPPPQRQPFSGVPAGVIQAQEGAAQDMMATTGVRFDATPQERMYDESGRALRELRRSGDITSFHYVDNFARSLRRAGEIILELIPKIYDTKRVLMILRDDDKEEKIQIDPSQQKPMDEMRDPQTKKVVKIYNPNIGKYGVTVTVGPSYATKRIESAESMMDFIRALPQTGEVLADLVAKNQDWPGADEMATRLAKVIGMKFPGVVGPNLKDVTPEVQAMLASMDAQIKQLGQERQQLLEMLTDQKEERALQADKINKDFEAKVMKIIADIETSNAKLQEEQRKNTAAQIADVNSNVEKIIGHVSKLEAAAFADKGKRTD